MALNTLKRNHLTSLGLKGLTVSQLTVHVNYKFYEDFSSGVRDSY